MPGLVVRNVEMVKLWRNGETSLCIAEKYNISVERVNRIIKKMDSLFPLLDEFLSSGYSNQDAFYFSKVLFELQNNFSGDAAESFKLFQFLYHHIEPDVAYRLFNILHSADINSINGFKRIKVNKLYCLKNVGSNSIARLKKLQEVSM